MINIIVYFGYFYNIEIINIGIYIRSIYFSGIIFEIVDF